MAGATRWVPVVRSCLIPGSSPDCEWNRLTALLRRVYARGRRLTVELVLRLSLLLDADNLLEKLATRFVVFDPAFLRDSVGHEFPPAPVGLISQSGER